MKGKFCKRNAELLLAGKWVKSTYSSEILTESQNILVCYLYGTF